MPILLNYNGLNNSFQQLSNCSDISLALMNKVIRENRILISPSRFKTIEGHKKELEQSLKLCSETREALFMYFGKDKLNKLKKLIGYDFVECILEEYISTLRKLNYDVGEGDFLLREACKGKRTQVVHASDIQLIEVKNI